MNLLATIYFIFIIFISLKSYLIIKKIFNVEYTLPKYFIMARSMLCQSKKAL